MAFPFLYEEGFEAGTLGGFNSETDTESRLDFPHYSTLAAIPGLAAPWRGAYCMRVNLANDGTPADAFVQEDDGFDAAAAATIWVRFMLWVSPTITMANADEFLILALQSSGPTNEGVIVINYTTAAGLRIGVGETAGTQFLPLQTGVWNAVELKAVIDNAGANDGTLNLYVNGIAATAVATLDQGAIVQARIGSMSQDAGTTAGVLLIDDVMVDDGQLYPPTFRFAHNPLFTASGHAFVGPGYVDAAQLMAGAATDNVLALYDTDTGNTSDPSKVRLEVKNVTNSAYVPAMVSEPIFFRRGCYVALTGTNPRAQLTIRSKYQSDGAIRSHGLKRVPLPGNV